MAQVRNFQRSFAGGEVTPELFGRIDDAKFQSGLALCRNFVTKPHGPAENRAGFAFVREVANSAKKTRLIPFTYSTTQTMVIELGEGYARFHTQGSTLLPGAAPDYVSTQTVASVNTGADTIQTVGPNVPGDGQGIVFLTTGTLPGGLAVATKYYMRDSDAAEFKVAATSGGAAINITSAGTGTHTFRWIYEVGDVVTYLGEKYYCFAENSSPPTDANYWHLMTDGVYEIPTPYLEDDLFDIHYVQSADVLTLVHPSYAPRELRRLSASEWTISEISFASSVSAPTGVTVVASGHTADKYTYTYVVTAIGADGISESVASSEVSDAGNLFETGGIVTISWGAVSGATRYNVFKLSGGLFGYIGQTAGLSIVDNNIAGDLSKTPPLYETPFSGADNYPGAVSYFEQRRAFAGTTNKPQNVWMTKSGTESAFAYSYPIRDDERISFRIAAREANTVRHIVPMGQLLLLTSSAEWRVTSQNSDAITPTTINVVPQSYVGSSNVQPQIVNNTAIYCAARGGHVRELAYNWQASGFLTGDLSLRAPHLFDGYDIKDMAYAKAPIPLVWFVSTSGKLLGLTYVPEQQVGAWHQHDTDGVFESCAVVAEGSEDVLYVVVKRTIDGNSVRYVERMASRAISDQADAFFVDCGATYDGVAADVISGLDFLEGKTVSILADGAVHPQRTVTGGSITLDIEASKVQIGLPIEADLQTLPFAAQIDNGFGQGRLKNVNKAWLRVFKSSGIFVGPSSDKLTEAKQRTTEPYGSPPELKSAEVPVMITPSWGDSGQVFIRQSDPLPLTVVSLTMEIEVGG